MCPRSLPVQWERWTWDWEVKTCTVGAFRVGAPTQGDSLGVLPGARVRGSGACRSPGGGEGLRVLSRGGCLRRLGGEGRGRPKLEGCGRMPRGHFLPGFGTEAPSGAEDPAGGLQGPESSGGHRPRFPRGSPWAASAWPSALTSSRELGP